MTQTRLPDGFAVQIDRGVRVLGGGSVLLGGVPTRLMCLAPSAQEMLHNGRLEVRDPKSAQLARTLLDATVAHPRPSGGPCHRDVTVVIPVRDNISGLLRLLSVLRNLSVVVVDDGSVSPIDPASLSAAHPTVSVLRHPRSRGPAAARNTGMAVCTTDFVAFLDSDVLPRRGWLEMLLGHFCDPEVALVAPRIVGMVGGNDMIERYEAMRSSLDLGSREAPVVPYGRVAYVPSAAIVCRAAALRRIGGFDETMRCGEDVDLCWRLLDAGDRLRYEPVALVEHDHRVVLGDWLARKVFYGRSGAPLSARHPDKTAPMMISLGALVAWLSAAFGSGLCLLSALVAAGLVARRVAGSMRCAGVGPAEVVVVTVRGLGAAGLQLASVVCRPYWPLAVLAAVFSRHCRRLVLLAAIVDGVTDWVRHAEPGDDGRPPLNPVAYLLLKRLDDLGYGAGLWSGVLREHDVAALRPRIRTSPARR